MAIQTFMDPYVLINSIDYSDHVASVTLTLTKELNQSTAAGDGSHTYVSDGMKDGTFSVEFNADYAAGEVDASLWAIYAGSAVVAFQLNPNGSSTSTTNPKYTGNCEMPNWTPMGGGVGDFAKVPASFQISGDVARATT